MGESCDLFHRRRRPAPGVALRSPGVAHLPVGVGIKLMVLYFVFLGLGHIDGGGRGRKVSLPWALITLAMPFRAAPAGVCPPDE